jgi:hypothetical protein
MRTSSPACTQVDDLRDQVEALRAALATAEAAATATTWLAGPPAAESTGQLAAWHAWMEEALTAWHQGRSLPAWTAAVTTAPAAACRGRICTTFPPCARAAMTLGLYRSWRR